VSNVWRRILQIVPGILLLGLTTGCLAHPEAPWKPIGQADEYDAWNGGCGRIETSVPSGGSEMATLREVECTGAPIVPPSRDYFIFIHRMGTSELNERGLAIAYRVFSDTGEWNLAPKLLWTSTSSLHITTGIPSIVTSQRSDIDGVRVTIRIGGGGEVISGAYRFRDGNGWQPLIPSSRPSQRHW
jgi:hypothetical protein